MIDQKIISKAWIEKISMANRNADKMLIEKVKTMASQAAYLMSLIKNGSTTIEKYSSPDEMKEWFIEDSNFGKIQRLKKTNPEAFYYWYKILNTQ